MGGFPPKKEFYLAKFQAKIPQNDQFKTVFQKMPENGCLPPIWMVFRKIRQNGWFSTTFYGFFEKPLKRVVFHHFLRFFEKTVEMGGFPPLLAVF